MSDDKIDYIPMTNEDVVIKGNKIHTLVPTKSDKDVANELRDKLIQVYQPVLDILTEAKRSGFDVNVQTGADGFNIVRLMNIQIMKQY